MKISDLKSEQIKTFLRNQWKPVSLVAVIFIILIITLLIPGKEKNTRNTPGRQTVSNETTKSNPEAGKKSFNPLSFIFPPKKDNNSRQQNIPTGVIIPPNATTTSTDKSIVIKVLPDGTKTTQTVTGTATVNTAQGTINTNTNIAQDLTSNTQVDNLRIIFQNPDGTTFTYIPPGTPPDEVRWARYTNNVAKYAINYPSNWQFAYSTENGNEGIALYPPGSNPNDPNSDYIGFGLTNSFLLPTGGDGGNALITGIIADGVSGNLYTEGPLGESYIASIFSYTGKYFGLAGSKSDVTFAYVYYYMLQSLTFNIE